ncbi:MAG: hypothetical protein JXB42_11380 [Deltaproteobacteria bacterium]|nr:hypothetical protein [Deltaproteobacteria bacterium]
MNETLKNTAIPQAEEKEPVDTILEKVQFVGLSGLGTVEDIRRKMAENKDIRDLIHESLMGEFVENVDYGPADDRNPKKVLLKPGAEKACRFFNTHAEWRRDDDVWEMLGRPAGTVCLKCVIVDNESGNIIGEGRGAEKVGNKMRDANKTIKAAEKCSIVDAALYTFMLSDRFTQDDAGKGKGNIKDNKISFFSHVGELRAGKNSNLTDVQFIVKVCSLEIHKKSITTQAELDIVWKAIDEGKYELETGDKFPQRYLPEQNSRKA